MALGDLSKSLKIISRAKGWDPDVIAGTGENIANFNKAPSPWIPTGDMSAGQLPEGIKDSYVTEAPATEDKAQWSRPGSTPKAADFSKAMDEMARRDWNVPTPSKGRQS